LLAGLLIILQIFSQVLNEESNNIAKLMKIKTFFFCRRANEKKKANEKRVKDMFEFAFHKGIF